MTRKGTKDRIDLMVVTLQTVDSGITVEITGPLEGSSEVARVRAAVEGAGLSHVKTRSRVRYDEPAGKKPAAP